MYDNERELNVMFKKSGSGSITPSIAVPISLLYDMGVTPEDRKVILAYDKSDHIITIRKKIE